MEISLSSFKRGFGLKELMSDDLNEYWCTEEQLPHLIKISFPKLTYVFSLRLTLNFIQDDSYTPEKFILYYNNKFREVEYNEPNIEAELLVCDHVFDIYLTIVENHSEGKDSHVRRLRVMESLTEEIKFDHSIFEK